MSSSHQLAVGYKGSLPNIRAQWLKLNHNRGYQVRVAQSTKSPEAIWLNVCASREKKGWKCHEVGLCNAHLHAKGKDRDDLTITSIDTQHSCNLSNAALRKRNYRLRDIADMSDVLDLYCPTARKEGNAKQYIKMAKAATGVSIKKGQAASAVRSKVNNRLEAQLGQYMCLPSLFAAYKELDPAGTYVCEDWACPWIETVPLPTIKAATGLPIALPRSTNAWEAKPR